MSRIVGVAVLAAIGGYLTLAAAQAQQVAPAATDQNFLMKAATSGMMEVKLGQLAMERATNADVKNFAQHIVRDHTMANKELMPLMTARSVALPKEMLPRHKQLWDRMSQLKGADFDRAFVQQMVDDHTEAVALFEQEAKNGQDPALKAFAAKTLPTLREHLKMAQDLNQKLQGK